MAQPIEMNVKVVGWATEAIKQNLGSLDDLPDELANTIANIYYRAGQIVLEDRSSGSLIESMKKTPRLDELTRGYIRGVSTLEKLKVVPGMVADLRSINKETHPNMYAMTWNLMLDVLKYDIENAMNKPEIWRRVERLFRRHTTKEIPRLAGLFRKTLTLGT